MKTFPPTGGISCCRNIRGIYWRRKIPYFQVTKFSKEWKIWPKTHCLVFDLFVGKFSNKHHYNLKIRRIFFFWYFCPKWLLPKLLVLKVDLCIKVVALIKITTVIVWITPSAWVLTVFLSVHRSTSLATNEGCSDMSNFIAMKRKIWVIIYRRRRQLSQFTSASLFSLETVKRILDRRLKISRPRWMNSRVYSKAFHYQSMRLVSQLI